MKPWED